MGSVIVRVGRVEGPGRLDSVLSISFANDWSVEGGEERGDNEPSVFMLSASFGDLVP